MGYPKGLLPFGPERMLERIARILADAVDPIVVVASHEQELPELPPRIAVIPDRRPDHGPLEGLAAGLAALERGVEAAYVTSCDVPLLNPDFVRRVIALLDRHEIAVPKIDGFHHPLAAVYRTSVLPRVEELLTAGRFGPMSLLEIADTREITADELTDVDPRLLSLMNLNRPGDYLAALAEAGFEPLPGICDRL
jgi:molybdopterin-guanine dinucleotide biosynthesis protein A